MSYRPQWAYPLPPPPCEAQPCQFSYDATNTPAFTNTSFASGAQTGRIPLKLDLDADFYLRAIRTQGAVWIRLLDPESNLLDDADNAKDIGNFEAPNQFSNPAGFDGTGWPGIVVLESGQWKLSESGGTGGVYAPAGSNFLLYLYNGTNAAINLTTCAVNLYGVKVYSGECIK
jgi:hypothetical protein